MRQATMSSPGVIQFGEAPAPSAGPGQVLLRVQAPCGVCGSDVHVYHGKHPFTPYPVVPGPRVLRPRRSDRRGRPQREGRQHRVTATPQEVCGTCRPCLRGDYHICDSLKVRGFQAPGCAQDLFVTEDRRRSSRCRESFTFEQGALVEPVAVGVHSVSRAGSVEGRNVAVLGAGPIGNSPRARSPRAAGARTLITDISEFRLGVARGMRPRPARRTRSRRYFATAAARVFGKQGFDVAFECAGVEETINAAIGAIQKGGTIVLVGVYGEKPRLEVGLVQDRELNLVGTLVYKYRGLHPGGRTDAPGGVITAPLDSSHFPFAQYPDAYRFIDQGCRSQHEGQRESSSTCDRGEKRC